MRKPASSTIGSPRMEIPLSERAKLMIPVIGITRLRMDTDGPGVRTLIGTYGCPLRCRYCLNPHSWQENRQVRAYTPEGLYQKTAIDSLYFQATGGGITIGGGEPLLHMDAIGEFAALCPDSWTLWAETSLNVPRKAVERAARIFNHFVVDIKTTDLEIYRAYTGGDLSVALENLLYLRDTVGAGRITVRLPVIPGYVEKAQRDQSAQWLREQGFEDLDLFTYRTNLENKG